MRDPSLLEQALTVVLVLGLVIGMPVAILAWAIRQHEEP